MSLAHGIFAAPKNAWNIFFLKQAIIWLFPGREVLNISRFLMDACLKGADDKSAPASGV